MYNRYGSLDFFRVLVAIEAKVRDLPCRGSHMDGGVAYQDLYDFITKERDACAVRVARTKAEQTRKAKKKEK